MIRESKKRDLNFHVIAIIIILFFCMLNILWVVKDTQIPQGHDVELIYYTMPLIKEKAIDCINAISHGESPLLRGLFFLYFKIFGIMTRNELAFVNTLFFLILLFSVYMITTKIYNNKVGLLSIIILNSFFIIILATRRFYIEFHILAFNSLSFWLLIETKKFRKTAYSILFGIAYGLTLLIKYNAGIYLSGIITIYFFISFLDSIILDKKKISFSKDGKNIIKNILLSILIILLVGGWWYFLNYSYLTSMMTTRKDIDNAAFHFENLSYHINFILNNIGAIVFFIFIAALIKKIISKKSFEEIILLLTPLPVLFIFSFISIYTFQHLIPIYFIIPVLVSGFLYSLKIKPAFKKIIFSLCLIYTLIIISQSLVPFINLPKNNIQAQIKIPTNTPTEIEQIFFRIKPFLLNSDNKRILLVCGTWQNIQDLYYLSITELQNYEIISYLLDDQLKGDLVFYVDAKNHYNAKSIGNIIQNYTPSVIIRYVPSWKDNKTDIFFHATYAIGDREMLKSDYRLLIENKLRVDDNKFLISETYIKNQV